MNDAPPRGIRSAAIAPFGSQADPFAREAEAEHAREVVAGYGSGDIFALFDDARSGGGTLLFDQPLEIFSAGTHNEIRTLLDWMRNSLAQGRWCAGYLSYEAAFGLERRLASLIRSDHNGPLGWFASFEAPIGLSGDTLIQSLPNDGPNMFSPIPLIARKDYIRSVSRVLDFIRQGDIYQLNLTFQAALGKCPNPLATYRAIRSKQMAGYSGILAMGNMTHLSFSPELFFAIRNGIIQARPMKGTAARHRDPQRDAEAKHFLRNDPKNRAENLMIVDLMRNDLARISRAGSVHVADLFYVESYPTVHQMTSTITATLKPETDTITVLEALFPCGSITGAPKIRAMELIGALETMPRGAYTGSFGWIAPNGDAQFNVAIRTVTVDEASEARIGLGSGLVAESEPEAEWLECLQKSRFLSDWRG